MVKEEINEKELRKKLLKIYEAFLKDPEDELVHRNATNYDREYGILEGDDSIADSTKKAIALLSFLFQYGLHENSSEISKEKIFNKAKKISEKLKKKI